MKSASTVVFLGLVLFCVSCRRQDIRTALIHVPEMKNEACVQRVVKAIERTPGVVKDSIEADRESRTVTVSYNSIELSLKNLEFQVAGTGFLANNVPADKNAAQKLPPECR